MVQESKPKIKKLTKEKIQEYVMESKDNKTMDLSNRGIENIISLEGLKGFTKLFLNSNKLTKLSDMKQVSHVTMLKVNDNKLSGEVMYAFD
jgi:Leucine-rich repeat (LRR) protein